MSLPLMPGSEPITVQIREPEPPQMPQGLADASGGCQCAMCVQERRIQTMQAAYGSTPGSGTVTGRFRDTARPEVNLNPPDRIRGRYIDDGVFGDTPRWLDQSTGRLYDESGSQMNTVIRDEFTGQWKTTSGTVWATDEPPRVEVSQVGRIQGRYSFPSGDYLNGRTRWLDPRTGEAYDEDGRSQWTFVLLDGEWVDRNRPAHKWVPDGVPVAIEAPRPVFNWEGPT